MTDQPQENGDLGKRKATGKPFVKGDPRCGRPAGVPNKISKSVAEMVKGALDDAGGQEWMLKQAREDPRGFGNLVSRLMPTKTEGKVAVRMEVGNSDGSGTAWLYAFLGEVAPRIEDADEPGGECEDADTPTE